MFFHMPESAGFKIQAVTTDMGPANTAVLLAPSPHVAN